jgi:hypothetical protein
LAFEKNRVNKVTIIISKFWPVLLNTMINISVLILFEVGRN